MYREYGEIAFGYGAWIRGGDEDAVQVWDSDVLRLGDLSQVFGERADAVENFEKNAFEGRTGERDFPSVQELSG